MSKLIVINDDQHLRLTSIRNKTEGKTYADVVEDLLICYGLPGEPFRRELMPGHADK